MMCITGLRVCLECLENTSTSTEIKLKGGRTQRNATQTSDYLPPQEAIYILKQTDQMGCQFGVKKKPLLPTRSSLLMDANLA